jgi:3' terminal RNA ribose 2'-O-methyltransferase Hen1
LDDRKHYWVGDAEVEKLMRNAAEWLPEHPLKEWITHRYFKHRRSLARVALEQLIREDSVETDSDDAELPPPAASREMELEKRVSLNERRLEKVTELVAALGVKTVVDMGCGEGKLLSQLLAIKALDRVVGMDVSLRSLEYASERLHLDRMPPRQRARIELIHSSLVYTDQRLSGFGAATLTEVVEHLDPPRLSALERTVFEAARPTFIIVTTPNREYNVKFEGLNPGQFRHGDHRFEWTRSEFHGWCERQCDRFGYQVEYHPVGDEDPQIGPPTQLALFSAATRD